MKKEDLEKKIESLKQTVKMLEDLKEELFGEKVEKEELIKGYDKSEFKIEGTKLVQYTGNKRKVEIPAGVTEIAPSAFYEKEKITSVKIPETVTCIGDTAFCRCKSLQSVNFPKKLKLIGDGAFYDCESLTGDITLPDGIEEIDTEAFEFCGGLERMFIPKSVKFIGRNAFEYCGGVEVYCASDEEDKNVAEWHNGWDTNSDSDSKYVNVFWNYDVFDKKTKINYNKNLFKIRGTVLEEYLGYSQTVEIPYGVKTIAINAFFRKVTTMKIFVPETVTTILDGAFLGCSNLIEIYITDGIKQILGTPFMYCNEKLTVYIGKSSGSIFLDAKIQNYSSFSNPAKYAKIVWDYKGYKGSNNLG